MDYYLPAAAVFFIIRIIRVLGVSLLLKRVTACLQLFISFGLHVISISSSRSIWTWGKQKVPLFYCKIKLFYTFKVPYYVKFTLAMLSKKVCAKTPLYGDHYLCDVTKGTNIWKVQTKHQF